MLLLLLRLLPKETSTRSSEPWRLCGLLSKEPFGNVLLLFLYVWATPALAHLLELVDQRLPVVVVAVRMLALLLAVAAAQILLFRMFRVRWPSPSTQTYQILAFAAGQRLLAVVAVAAVAAAQRPRASAVQIHRQTFSSTARWSRWSLGKPFPPSLRHLMMIYFVTRHTKDYGETESFFLITDRSRVWRALMPCVWQNMARVELMS